MSDYRNDALNAIKKHKEDFNEYWDKAKYTESIVAFIDVMGTKELFSDNTNDFDVHSAIYKAWNEIECRQQLPEYQKYLHELYGDFNIKSTLMSDGIVLSIDAGITNAFSKLFTVLGVFSNSLLALNPPRFTRGAVTTGNIYHEKNVVFGPALIEAYLLERDNAKNFRFIINENDYKNACDSGEGDFKNFLQAYFRLDDDGYYSFDYLYKFFGSMDNWVHTGENSNGYLNILGRLQKKIRHEIVNNSSADIRNKYKWMEQYFIRAMTLVLKHSDDDEYIWLKKARDEWRKQAKCVRPQ